MTLEKDVKLISSEQTLVELFNENYIKGTLTQILKFPYMFVLIWKQYPENLEFLIQKILRLFAHEVGKLLKK